CEGLRRSHGPPRADESAALRRPPLPLPSPPPAARAPLPDRSSACPCLRNAAETVPPPSPAPCHVRPAFRLPPLRPSSTSFVARVCACALIQVVALESVKRNTMAPLPPLARLAPMSTRGTLGTRGTRLVQSAHVCSAPLSPSLRHVAGDRS